MCDVCGVVQGWTLFLLGGISVAVDATTPNNVLEWHTLQRLRTILNEQLAAAAALLLCACVVGSELGFCTAPPMQRDTPIATKGRHVGPMEIRSK